MDINWNKIFIDALYSGLIIVWPIFKPLLIGALVMALVWFIIRSFIHLRGVVSGDSKRDILKQERQARIGFDIFSIVIDFLHK